jgi:hypothetical protein
MAEAEKEPVYPIIEAGKLPQEAQLELAEQLQAMLLRTYHTRLKAGTISDTGLAALQRLLQQNGWSLDPAQLPKGLRDMITSKVDPTELDDDVLPFRKQA